MFEKRINLVLFSIILFGAAIIGRLVYIQIFKYDFYKALAQGQHKLLESVRPQRGEIFAKDKDQNIYLLATNKEKTLVFVETTKLKEKKEIIHSLSEILNLDPRDILKKIQESDESFLVLKRDLSDQEIKKIKELHIEGVYLEKEIRRYYPHNNFASYVSGS